MSSAECHCLHDIYHVSYLPSRCTGSISYAFLTEPIHLLLRTTLTTELGASIHFRATVRAKFLRCQGLAAFRAELAAADLRAAMWAGGDNGLLELIR
jgi:hypothetical protein